MKYILYVAVFIATTTVSTAQVGLGTFAPNENAVLEVSSTTQGMAFPRVSAMTDITNPATGVMVYDMDADCLAVNVGTPAAPDWKCTGISTLEQIGLEADAANNIPSVVTVEELNGIEGVSAAVLANQANYQTYIDANPDLFSAPATVAEVNAMIDEVNTPSGDATFVLPIDKKILSFDAESGGTGDFQGVIDNVANVVTYTVPYTAGSGAYAAYTSDPISVTGVAGDSNMLTISYPAGSFSSTGNIPVTVTVTDNDASFDVEKQLASINVLFATFDFKVNGTSKGNLTLTASGGIPDRRFGDGSGHDFLYQEVTSATGDVWLNHNLGADYANVNHASFNPGQQATAANDHLAYGSFFQWGRYSDGHELINYTSATAGTAVNGTASDNADTPGHGNFITETSSPYDWRSSQSSALWQGVAGTNNPCPEGYKVPIEAELEAERLSWGTNNSAGAFNSPLKLPVAGYRNGSNGTLYDVGTGGYYWSSTVGVTSARNLAFYSSNARMLYYIRADGCSVRCIKD